MPADNFNIEKELLLRIAAGDEAAFTQVFNTFRNKIFSVAYKLTESQAMAEEILQDVFLKIWLKREKLAEVNDFSSYLFIITRNHTFTLLKQLARARKLQSDLQESQPVNDLNSDTFLLDKEYQRILQEAINKLSPQQKRVYQLSKTEKLKRDEVAEQMGISPETVKIHLGNAMKIIRAYCMARIGPFILFLIYLTHFSFFKVFM